MRRALAILIALTAATFAAPTQAAEASGILEVVSRGPARGTLTLAHAARLDSSRQPSLLTPNPYVLLAVSVKGKEYLAVGNGPGATTWEWRTGWEDTIPAGRSTVQVLTEGPLRMLVPVRGFSGTRKVVLGSRLRGGSVTIRDIQPNAAGVVEDRIPFTLPAGGVVMHGYIRRALLFAASHDDYCVTKRGDRCSIGLSIPPRSPRLADWTRESERIYDSQFVRGEADGYAFSADVGVDLGIVTHYVLVLPTA